jgi:hypothetical protein
MLATLWDVMTDMWMGESMGVLLVQQWGMLLALKEQQMEQK